MKRNMKSVLISNVIAISLFHFAQFSLLPPSHLSSGSKLMAQEAATRALVIKPRKKAMPTPVGYKSTHALLIGVSDYDQRKNEGAWLDLRSIPKELDLLQTTLTDLGFQVTRIKNPNNKQLEEAFEDFIDDYGYDENARLLFYLKGAEKDYVLAMANVGYCYQMGLGTAQDFIKAIKWYEKAAAKNDGASMNNMAVIYRDGKKGVPKDSAKARVWFQKASDLNEPYATYQLGKFLRKGIGGPADMKLGNELIFKSAEAGERNAKNYLGYLYQTGGLGKKNPEAAFEWYLAAAKEGHHTAMSNLGTCYENGTGVEMNIKEAVKWYRKSVELKDPGGIMNLGILYKKGLGVKQNDKEAVRLFRLGADLNDYYSMTQLAYMYKYGRGIEQSFERAIHWYKKSIEVGQHARAMNNLAVMYLNGQGVKQDMKQAAKLFRLAADKRDNIAIFNMGVITENGDGVEKDRDKAIEWYKRADAAGYKDAKRELNRLGVTFGQ